MAKNKTEETIVDPMDFLMQIEDEKKRKDGIELLELFEKTTGFPAKMWGPTIVGFGSYHYKYASGHEGDMALVGFSPRKDNITLYIMNESERRDELLKDFGKHKASKGCIYVKKVEDINTERMVQMIEESIVETKRMHPD